MCVEKKRFSFSLFVYRSTRAGCTLGNSKARAEATPLPRGLAEPTTASDLDIYNENENDKNDDDDKNDDIDNDNDNDNVEDLKNTKKQKNPCSFHSGSVST